MTSTKKLGSIRLHAGSSEKLADITDFHQQLAERKKELSAIQSMILTLSWKVADRLDLLDEEDLRISDGYFRAKYNESMKALYRLSGRHMEDILIDISGVDIKNYMPSIGRSILRMLESSHQTSSPFLEQDWKRLSIAVVTLSKNSASFEEAFLLVSIVGWYIDRSPDDNLMDDQHFTEMKQYIEKEYRKGLNLACKNLSEVIEKGDLSSITATILTIRASLVLDGMLISDELLPLVSQVIQDLSKEFEKVNSQLANKINHLNKCLREGLLDDDWQMVNAICKESSTIVEVDLLDLAIDLEWDILILKTRRMTAFAGYLLLSNSSNLSQQSLDHLEQTLAFVEGTHRPHRKLDTLRALITSNDLRSVLQLSKSISLQNAIQDTLKVVDYLLPSGLVPESFTSGPNLLKSFKTLEDADTIHVVKFITDWFVAPAVIAGVQFPDEDGFNVFFQACQEFNQIVVLDGFDNEFCISLLLALEKVLPEHDPILVGQAIRLYIDLITRFGTLPKESNALVELLLQAYGNSMGDTYRRFSEAVFHKRLTSVIEASKDDMVQGFLRRYFESIGLLVTKEFCDQLDKITIRSEPKIPRGVGSIPKDLSKGWWQSHDTYCSLREASDTILNGEIQKIGNVARKLCKMMLKGRQIMVTTEIEGKWAGKIQRVLIARLVLLGMAKGEPDLGHRLYLMGFIKSKEYLEKDLSAYRENYRQYAHQVGLGQKVMDNPEGMDGLWPEEREWLNDYTPPSR